MLDLIEPLLEKRGLSFVRLDGSVKIYADLASPSVVACNKFINWREPVFRETQFHTKPLHPA